MNGDERAKGESPLRDLYDDPRLFAAEVAAESRATPLLWGCAIACVVAFTLFRFLQVTAQTRRSGAALDGNGIAHEVGRVFGFVLGGLIAVGLAALLRRRLTQRAKVKVFLGASLLQVVPQLLLTLSLLGLDRYPHARPSSPGTALADPKRMFEQRGAAHSDAGIPLPRELTFRWPSTGALRVTESVSKQGTHVRLRYLLQWMHKGTDLVLHFDDVEFLEVLGGSADTQDDRKRIVDALSTMGVMPAITIDAEGQLRDVRGMEDLVDRALRLTPSRTAKDRKKLIEWMKSGHMQALVKQRAGMTWAGWAGGWAGFEVPASGTAEVTGSVTLGETTIEGPTVVAVRSAPEGRVLLLRTIVIENQEAKAAAAAVIRQLGKGLGVRGSPPEGLIRDVKFTSVAAIETDPATLVPAMVSHGVRNEVTLDGERHLFEESHEYAFAPP